MRTGSANAFASISRASSRPRNTDVTSTVLFDRNSANVASRSSIERSRASRFGAFTWLLIVREIVRGLAATSADLLREAPGHVCHDSRHGANACADWVPMWRALWLTC